MEVEGGVSKIQRKRKHILSLGTYGVYDNLSSTVFSLAPIDIAKKYFISSFRACVNA